MKRSRDSLAERAERRTFLAVIVGMVMFFIADDQPLLALVAVVLAATGRSLALQLSREKPPGLDAAPASNTGPARDAGPIPRWALHALVVGAVAYAALSAIRDPEDFVAAIGALLCALQVIRFFDRLRPADLRQLLTMSLFTAVAATLTSNALLVGALLVAYAPIAASAVIAHQVSIAHERVRRRSPHTPEPAPGPRFGRDTRRLIFASTTFACLFAAFVFVILPRNLGADMLGEWSSPTAGGATTVGFAEKVQLGRSGELAESQQPVLDLLLTDERGRNVGSPDRAVLLRGLVFDEYNPATRAWVRSRAAEEQRTYKTAPGVFPTEVTRRRGVEFLSQRITLRDKRSDYLFAIARPVAIAFDRETNIAIGGADNVLSAPQRSGRVTYTVESQIDYSATPDQTRASRMPALFRDGRVRQFAEQTIREAGYARDPQAHFTQEDLLIARAIEKRLRADFAYTLEMVPPDEGEDPIEMFLFRTRQGHCEYFASAMAAMLRSLGMDARVVGGYRAAEFNDIAGQYTVRQSDAHSWVEAQVAPGMWVTFDPSPPDGMAAAARRPRGILAAARHLYDAAEQSWVAWVVGFDHQARTSIFGTPQGNLHRFTRRFDDLGQLPRAQLAMRLVRSVLAGMLVFAVASLLFGGVGWLWGLWRGRRRRAPRPGEDPAAAAFRRAREAQAAFYAGLLKAMESLGAGKPRWRSPMEHIDASAARLGPAAADARALTRLYYTLRFAPRLLTDAELAEARSHLDAVNAAARDAEKSRPRTRPAPDSDRPAPAPA